eukprot:CAMPEP_0183585806 /NCGR_PEP_ID=MMETSP0371-20130417/156031_1 /TAXON_ID=268820 /ORGANISM="Peridinium aciculiferum, Strain PAER-2" /LENGTH=46 /DNA_ID= /DNA_START= /DNA_END= /DNA_ORIENTATION=
MPTDKRTSAKPQGITNVLQQHSSVPLQPTACVPAVQPFPTEQEANG